MQIAATRTEQLERIVQAKRRAHRELRKPLSWSAFREICTREGVIVTLAVVERPACIFGFQGAWTILLSSRGVRQLHYGAHELGHLWAHIDQEPLGRFEATYYMDTGWPDDPREDEADYMAALLLMGPGRQL